MTRVQNAVDTGFTSVERPEKLMSTRKIQCKQRYRRRWGGLTKNKPREYTAVGHDWRAGEQVRKYKKSQP
jgi:hypothetical protein